MYIEEIARTPKCTLKLSCLDPQTNALLDFNAVLLQDTALKQKLSMFLAKKKISHYILVNNIIYDKKNIDFASHSVQSTLYAILPNGKTYRWRNVSVSFIKIGTDSNATCIISKQNATEYNRRDKFRIPVDCPGFVQWDGLDMPDRCIIKDVSHDGVGIMLKKTSTKIFKGMPATVSWEETAKFDGTDRVTTRNFKIPAEIVRRKTQLDGNIIVGFRVPEEPQAINEYITWAQKQMGLNQEKKKFSDNPKGINKQENWQLQKQLEQMSGEQ
ncbi:MAG: hypothetical protein K5644_08315 [Lachnospiraceae bacterium]|nr:hypothetical protein [Lachnospiraceae bacterium]